MGAAALQRESGNVQGLLRSRLRTHFRYILLPKANKKYIPYTRDGVGVGSRVDVKGSGEDGRVKSDRDLSRQQLYGRI